MTPLPDIRKRRSNAALAALFLATFVLGSAELLVVGVLTLVADDLGVSIGSAGLLVTAYAVGIAIGGPVLTALSLKARRRPLLLASVVAYIAGNAAAVVAPDLAILLAARVVTGSIHGLIVGAALTVAVSLVPPERAGRAISIVIGGIAASTALGLPIGTLVGQALGWRLSFAAIVGLGVVALVASALTIPNVERPAAISLATQVRHALAPRVIAVLGVGFLLLGGQFAALTYLAPFLERTTGISGGLIGLFLFAYGVATALGVFLGGWAADRSPTRTLVASNVILVVALTVLLVAGAHPVPAVFALVAWGVVGFGLVPSLQHRVITLAGPGRDLASTLPASAVNAGIAVGAVLGGRATDVAGVEAAMLVGLVTLVIALPATWATARLRRPGGERAETIVATATMYEDRDREIFQLVERLQAAQSDVEPFLALHTPDAIIVNFVGRRVVGKDDIRPAMEASLASPLSQVVTTAQIDDIRYVRPDVAIISCTKRVFDERDKTETFSTEGRLTYVAVENDGVWRVALAQTTPVAGILDSRTVTSEPERR